MTKFKLNTEHITIETTNICNANCVFCPREKYNMKPETMKMELWKKIIDELETHNYEHLKIDTQGFGEPFLDPKFFDRLEYARKKIPNTKFFTSSNCTKMTKDKFSLICKYIDTLRTSFYAMTKETYDKTQGGNAVFEDALYNILDFIEYKNNTIGIKKPWLIMQMEIVDGYNDHEINRWREFWEPRADEIMIWRLHNFGGLRPDYRKIDHTKQISCGRPTHGPAYVHVDGIVSMCCWDINERLVIGDLNTQTLEEIFHDQPYKMIREKHLKNDFRGLYCYHCEQTTPDKNCLYYTNQNRKLCTMTSDHLDFNTGEYKK